MTPGGTKNTRNVHGPRSMRAALRLWLPDFFKLVADFFGLVGFFGLAADFFGLVADFFVCVADFFGLPSGGGVGVAKKRQTYTRQAWGTHHGGPFF